MKKPWKVVFVLTGYAIAFLAACGAVALRYAFADPADVQASGGMYAFGDACIFIGVFGLLGLIPTGATLIFLRTRRGLWIALSAVCVAIALTGAGEVVAWNVAKMTDWGALAPIRILGAPLLALVFAVFAVIASHRPSRIALALSMLTEIGVSVYGWYTWFLPLHH